MAERIEVCTKRLTTWQIYNNANCLRRTVHPNGLKNADTSHINVIVRRCRRSRRSRRCRRDKSRSCRRSICQSKRFHLTFTSVAYFRIHLAKEHGRDGWGWNGNSLEWCAKQNHPCVTHSACLCCWWIWGRVTHNRNERMTWTQRCLSFFADFYFFFNSHTKWDTGQSASIPFWIAKRIEAAIYFEGEHLAAAKSIWFLIHKFRRLFREWKKIKIKQQNRERTARNNQ